MCQENSTANKESGLTLALCSAEPGGTAPAAHLLTPHAMGVPVGPGLLVLTQSGNNLFKTRSERSHMLWVIQ